MATYRTVSREDITRGNWEKDADLVIEIAEIAKGGDVVPATVVPATGAPSTGTQVSWSGPDGNGNITFFNEGRLFNGSYQSKYDEEPMGYMGQLKG